MAHWQEHSNLINNDCEPRNREEMIEQMKRETVEFARNHKKKLVDLKYDIMLEPVEHEKWIKAVDFEIGRGAKARIDALAGLKNSPINSEKSPIALSTTPKRDLQYTTPRNGTVSINTRHRTQDENQDSPRCHYFNDPTMPLFSKCLRHLIFAKAIANLAAFLASHPRLQDSLCNILPTFLLFPGSKNTILGTYISTETKLSKFIITI